MIRLGPFWNSCRARQPAGEQHDGCGIEIGIGAGGEGFEVLGEASIAAKPGEGSLDHPSAGQDLEALRVGGALDDFEDPRAEAGDGFCRFFAGIAGIGEDLLQPGKQPEQGRELQWSAVAVLDVGAMHDRRQ